MLQVQQFMTHPEDSMRVTTDGLRKPIKENIENICKAWHAAGLRPDDHGYYRLDVGGKLYSVRQSFPLVYVTQECKLEECQAHLEQLLAD